MNKLIEDTILDSIRIKKMLLSESDTILQISERVSSAYKNGNKVLLCGNGGSASDAMHVAGELEGRFLMERRGLPAIVLGTNTAAATAIANDYGYSSVFCRELEACGATGDVLLAFSTSGNSENIVLAVSRAKEMGIFTIGFLGSGGGKLGPMCDIPIIINSNTAARVQECHILIGHIVCDLVEKELFKA